MTDEAKAQPRLYLPNVLTSAGVGHQADVRFSLAVDIIKGDLLADFFTRSACSTDVPLEGCCTAVAGAALNIAEEMVRISEKRGWLKPMPDDDDLSAANRREIRRSGRALSYAQISGQAMHREESKDAPRVAAPAGRA